jgi:hypothetical protein
VPDVDPTTGAFVHRVPFDIPPGRTGLTPDLAPVNNSQQLDDGIGALVACRAGARVNPREVEMSRSVTRRTFVKSGIATTAALPFTGARAWAQAWPSRPIKIVCSSFAGGLMDLLARAYGDYLSRKLGQPVVVENKPGAGGAVAALL